MNSYRIIKMAEWPRRQMYDYYRTFDSPAYNVTVMIPAQTLHRYAKEHGESFFLLSLYAILRAANQVPQMRQRVVDGSLVEFDRIAAMTPVMTGEEMFRQVWCEYEADFPTFRQQVEPLVAAAGAGEPAPMPEHGEDFFCASCNPWTHFSAVTQADYSFHQFVPILAWGKMSAEGIVPVACKFNHCLMDGLHTGRFFDNVEANFGAPESLYRALPIP